MIANELKEQKKVENFLLPSNQMNHLMENLRWYRKKKKWTQEQMGAVFNVKRTVIASYETGASTPGVYMVCEICKDLKVYLHDFINQDLATWWSEDMLTAGDEQTKTIAAMEALIQEQKEKIAQLEMLVELQKFKLEKLEGDIRK